jgi:hypothetical protein
MRHARRRRFRQHPIRTGADVDHHLADRAAALEQRVRLAGLLQQKRCQSSSGASRPSSTSRVISVRIAPCRSRPAPVSMGSSMNTTWRERAFACIDDRSSVLREFAVATCPPSRAGEADGDVGAADRIDHGVEAAPAVSRATWASGFSLR